MYTGAGGPERHLRPRRRLFLGRHPFQRLTWQTTSTIVALGFPEDIRQGRGAQGAIAMRLLRQLAGLCPSKLRGYSEQQKGKERGREGTEGRLYSTGATTDGGGKWKRSYLGFTVAIMLRAPGCASSQLGLLPSCLFLPLCPRLIHASEDYQASAGLCTSNHGQTNHSLRRGSSSSTRY